MDILWKGLAFEKGYLEYDETFYNKHGNLVTEHNYSLGIIPDFDCSAPYQAELQQWLREEHGIAVLVTLDETLSYYWIIVPLHPKSSIQGSPRNLVWSVWGLFRIWITGCIEDAIKYSW